MKIETKKACGEIFSETMSHFCDNDDKAYGFAVGFAVGQAEKVALGACPAYMVRIMPEHYESFSKAVLTIAQKYSLRLEEKRYMNPETGKEIIELWSFRGDIYEILDWSSVEVNSNGFHSMRATNCGIHYSLVDFRYHKYKGYLGRTALEYKGK